MASLESLARGLRPRLDADGVLRGALRGTPFTVRVTDVGDRVEVTAGERDVANRFAGLAFSRRAPGTGSGLADIGHGVDVRGGAPAASLLSPAVRGAATRLVALGGGFADGVATAPCRRRRRAVRPRIAACAILVAALDALPRYEGERLLDAIRFDAATRGEVSLARAVELRDDPRLLRVALAEALAVPGWLPAESLARALREAVARETSPKRSASWVDEAMSTDDPLLLSAALELAGQHDLPVSTERLEDLAAARGLPNPIRRAAISLRARRDDARREAALCVLLRERDGEIVEAAAVALGKVGTLAAIPPLRAAQPGFFETALRARIENAIHEIQSREHGSAGTLTIADRGRGDLSVPPSGPHRKR